MSEIDLFAQHFGERLAVLCVIHVADERQALMNTETAFGAGADGVFLINHGVHVEDLAQIAAVVRFDHPSAWVGINLLGAEPLEAARAVVEIGLDGLWCDDMRDSDPAAVRAALARVTGRRPLYFAGVEFKYRPSTGDPAQAARDAAPLVDVVTTSGDATGSAADPEKLMVMRAAAPTARLGLASGVTPENASTYAPHLDAIIVATGVSRSFHFLDGDRVAALVGAVR